MSRAHYVFTKTGVFFETITTFEKCENYFCALKNNIFQRIQRWLTNCTFVKVSCNFNMAWLEVLCSPKYVDASLIRYKGIKAGGKVRGKITGGERKQQPAIVQCIKYEAAATDEWWCHVCVKHLLHLLNRDRNQILESFSKTFGGFSFRQFVYLFGERISYLRESVLSVLLALITDTRISHVITYECSLIHCFLHRHMRTLDIL